MGHATPLPVVGAGPFGLAMSAWARRLGIEHRPPRDGLPDLHRSHLAAGGLLPRIETVDGSPVLDESLQTTDPGLFITSIPATRDFGAFFAFTVSVRAPAKIIGRALVGGAFQRAGAVR